MTMTQLTIQIPEHLSRELHSEEEVVAALEVGVKMQRIERAIDAYARGGMSLASAAEMAGVSRSEMSCYAYARGLRPAFDEQMVAEELGLSANGR